MDNTDSLAHKLMLAVERCLPSMVLFGPDANEQAVLDLIDKVFKMERELTSLKGEDNG